VGGNFHSRTSLTKSFPVIATFQIPLCWKISHILSKMHYNGKSHVDYRTTGNKFHYTELPEMSATSSKLPREKSEKSRQPLSGGSFGETRV